MPSQQRLPRSITAIPMIGRIAREVVEGPADTKWYLAVTLLTLWILAGMTWGLAAVVMPFLMAVPLCLMMLVALTRG
jgi:hypothetical protein